MGRFYPYEAVNLPVPNQGVLILPILRENVDVKLETSGMRKLLQLYPPPYRIQSQNAL
jgi:hypothetical protein